MRRPLALGLLVLLALAPAAEAARPGYEVQPRQLRLKLELPGSHGYRLEVQTRGHRQVTLSAQRGEVGAAYRVLGRVSRHRINANFGRLGRVRGRFIGSPFHPYRGSPLHKRCRGRRPTFERGTFRGVIRFRGEHGYTRARARRVRAYLTRVYRRVCTRRFEPIGSRRPATSGGPRLYMTTLEAARRGHGRRTFFGAAGLQLEAGRNSESEPGLFVLAATEERARRVAVIRTAVQANVGDGILLTPPRKRPVKATVALPRPFAGSAEFHQPAPPAERWEGTLVVRLPGAGRVRLTGRGFHVRFCRAASPERIERCAKRRAAGREGAPLAMQEAERILRRRLGLHRALAPGARLRSAVPSP